MKKHFLHKVFEPKSVAIVGASDRETRRGPAGRGGDIARTYNVLRYP